MLAKLLVIPSIEIRDGRVVVFAGCDEGVVFDDPEQMARLWRIQDAKSIALRVDGQQDDKVAWVTRIAAAVNVPLQLFAGSVNPQECEQLIRSGANRLLVDADCLADIASYVDVGLVAPVISDAQEIMTACRRVVYEAGQLNEEAIRFLAGVHEKSPDLCVTVAGEVASFKELRDFQEALPWVDSWIAGECLYKEVFPCQQLWCWHEKSSIDLASVSTARLKSTDE